MAFAAIKFFVSAAIIAAASELARRSTAFAALLISLPLVSILSFSWVYLDSRDPEKVAVLSMSTLWLVVPSLVFFPILTVALRFGINYWLSLGVSIVLTFAAYFVYWKLLGLFNIHL